MLINLQVSMISSGISKSKSYGEGKLESFWSKRKTLSFGSKFGEFIWNIWRHIKISKSEWYVVIACFYGMMMLIYNCNDGRILIIYQKFRMNLRRRESGEPLPAWHGRTGTLEEEESQEETRQSANSFHCSGVSKYVIYNNNNNNNNKSQQWWQ